MKERIWEGEVSPSLRKLPLRVNVSPLPPQDRQVQPEVRGE